ncbi:hypothetical protein F5880DRAFT_1451257, partial [Lentinula raphanica]
LLSVTYDNASANTAMLDELATHLDDFLGEKMHVRCIAHTINLTAKGVLQPFEATKSQRQPDDTANFEDDE